MKKAIGVVVLVVLSFVAACTPAAPTPTRTPEPRPTQAEVRATKPEHLAGIWRLGGEVGVGPTYGGRYYRWDPDGAVWWAEDPEMTKTLFSANYWFENGVYHEGESPACLGTGSYEVYLQIEAGRAVRLRMKVIEDGLAIDGCLRQTRYASPFVRFD